MEGTHARSERQADGRNDPGRQGCIDSIRQERAQHERTETARPADPEKARARHSQALGDPAVVWRARPTRPSMLSSSVPMNVPVLEATLGNVSALRANEFDRGLSETDDVEAPLGAAARC